MTREFIPYEQALALKELGFDEPCLATYHKELHTIIPIYAKYTNQDVIKAPLYQQAFRWFREKYNLDGSMSVDVWNKKTVSYRITGGIENVIEADSYGSLYDIDSKEFLTYEEAELVCLEKLIEIVKNK